MTYESREDAVSLLNAFELKKKGSVFAFTEKLAVQTKSYVTNNKVYSLHEKNLSNAKQKLSKK